MPDRSLAKPGAQQVAARLEGADRRLSEVFSRSYLLLPAEQRHALVLDIMAILDEEDGMAILDAVLLLNRRIHGSMNLPSYAWTLTHTPRVRVAH
jgi:hypothetical protein